MSCRCDDIADCQDDMEKLREMIDYLDQAARQAETIEDLLRDTAGATREAVRSIRIDDFQTAMSKLDDRVIEIIRNARQDAERKLDYCERQLPRMEDEDERYHEEEEGDDDD